MAKKKDKPAKPYEGFPLYAHAAGYWAKDFYRDGRRKTHYFGRWEDGPQAALESYNEQKEALQAGHDPATYNQGLTVGLACDHFLAAKRGLRDSGELKPRPTTITT